MVGDKQLADIEALAAEVGAGDDPPADGAAPVDAEPEPVSTEPDPAMVEVMAVAVATIGGIITSRAKVSPLSDEETHAVGGAAARVLAQYNLALDPKAAAWVGLGLAVVGVAAPRLREVKDRPAEDPEPIDMTVARDATSAAGYFPPDRAEDEVIDPE